MRSIIVESESATEFNVSNRHFGGNIIGSFHTDNGTTNDNFREAIDALDVSDLRYPAGEPDVIYAAGMLADGGLPEHVHNFFRSIEDREGQVVMVTPTFGSYTGPEELRRFAELVMESYGDKVRAWEIGNEYWQLQNETEYGRIANEAVEAISEAMNDVGATTDIWVQMGNASGAASDFRDHPTLGWVDSTIEANKTIISQLSPESIARIDGLVEHVYLRDHSQIVGDEVDATNMAHLDLATWVAETGRDFDFAVTEWNVKTNNLEQHGLKGGSALLQHAENLLRLGADDMHIWAPQHNTKTDLAGSNQVLLDSVTGMVNNTVLGGVFDAMSSALPGKTLLNVTISDLDADITAHAFANETQLTLYIASRSKEVEDFSLDLGSVFGRSSLEDALVIGYDRVTGSSDGQHFSQEAGAFVPADFVLVDGEPYFFNEHDANASFEQLDITGIASDDAFAFQLLPYEIVQLTYTINKDVSQLRTRQADTLENGDSDSIIDALAGNDTVDAGAGMDTVFAGGGDDHVILGSGDDLGYGQDGHDFLSGWGGHDEMHGGDGNDTLYGFQGNDTVSGNAGNDRLRGDEGHDVLSGGQQNDRIDGGDGQDTLNGDAGHDFLEGDAGADTLMGGDGADRMTGGTGADQLSGGAGNDFLSGGDQSDLLQGDAGSDTMLGGDGGDTLEGGDGADNLMGGQGDDDLAGGTGTDHLSGGTGDDLLSGNSDADTFEFHDGHGNDVVVDFETDLVDEQLDFAGLTVLTRFQDVMQNAIQDADDVVIETGSQSSVRLQNTQLDDLTADDFVF